MTEITRGRQFELPEPPAPEAEPDERPFGLMLRRPGDVENVYLAPGFDVPVSQLSASAEGDPRWGQNAAQDWSLSLPHQCQEWEISDGTRADVLAAARRFRDELNGAITAMEAADG